MAPREAVVLGLGHVDFSKAREGSHEHAQGAVGSGRVREGLDHALRHVLDVDRPVPLPRPPVVLGHLSKP